MDDAMYEKVQQYLKALKALQRSVEAAIQNGTFDGTGRMAVKSYQGIQRKIAEFFPDDFYISDTLTLEVGDDVKERHMVSQVQLAASQMIIYVDGLLREHRVSSGGGVTDFSDLRSLGRDLQEQILRTTKHTLRQALQNVDVDVQGPDSMAGANLENAQLENANFSGRNLKGAHMANANLQNANFSGANLADANLENADAGDTNFSGANLKNAVLINVNFANANLTGANFKNAVLEGADLTGAKIGGANFKDAAMQGATLPRGEMFSDEGELMRYGAAARPSSTGKQHVRIEISHSEEDEGHAPHLPHQPHEPHEPHFPHDPHDDER
ncbi:MAG: pentapeptide repeat-containing protein [Chloroflexota bacterium]